jgi:UDP-N-acetylmuramate dehydrogenase
LRLLENIPLAPLTTLGIGGPARWFAEAASEAEIAEAGAWARERGVPLFVMGGGSNLVIADTGFNGLVMRITLKGIARDGEVFRAAAGEPWEHCVQQSTEAGYAGLECLTGIPGTVGGTPVQNVGAYGQEVASVIERVRVFDMEAREFLELGNAECGFAYRRSRFNTTDRGRFVVTRVDYRLTQGGAPTVRYADVERELEASGFSRVEPSLTEVAKAVRRVRRRKGMLLVEGDPNTHSVGSFFKNPVVSAEQFGEIGARSGSTPPSFPAGGDAEKARSVKVPAAWLIEQAGFAKGYALGHAGISTQHTLALVNRGGATAAEIMALAEKVRAAVEARFGIRLEMEPVLLGFEKQG